VLGPLLNPGRPAHTLLGVFAESWVPKLAGALETLGAPAALAVHGRLAPDRGIDELTASSPNRVQGVGRLSSVQGEWTPEQFGLPRCSFADLTGGDLATNLALADGLLDGTAPAGLIDTVVWNAATALWIVGQTPRVEDGLGLARELLLGGAVRRKLSDARSFYGGDPT
jgi:anthranilate phosphoribosyltransferase